MHIWAITPLAGRARANHGARHCLGGWLVAVKTPNVPQNHQLTKSRNPDEKQTTSILANQMKVYWTPDSRLRRISTLFAVVIARLLNVVRKVRGPGSPFARPTRGDRIYGVGVNTFLRYSEPENGRRFSSRNQRFHNEVTTIETFVSKCPVA